MSSYAYISNDNYLMHYGVLGMKWGVRRYQPYTKSSIRDPRANAKIAKRNVKNAYRDLVSESHRITTTEKRIEKINKKVSRGRMAKGEAKSRINALKSDQKYKNANKVVNSSISELRKAEKVLGRQQVLKQLQNQQRARFLVNSAIGTVAYNAGLTAVIAMGIPVIAPPFIVTPDRKGSAAAKMVNERLYNNKKK